MIDGFAGELVTTSAATYDRARRVRNARIDRRPALIAYCADVADVQLAVRYAVGRGLAVAPRGGGCNVAGWGTCDDGVVVDVRGLTHIDIDPERSTAVVGAGLTWGELDSALGRHGLAVPGPRNPDVGIAGHTLGGGVGDLSRLYGLTSDNVVAMEIVTAAGDVAVVDEEGDPELFWALRGGSGNFGVVTAFTYQVHPVDEIVAGPVVHRIDTAPEVLRTMRDWLRDAPPEASVVALLWTAPPADFIPADLHYERCLILVPTYFGDPAHASGTLAPLRAGAVADLVRTTRYVDHQRTLPSHPDAATQNVYNRGELLDELSDATIDSLVAQFRSAGPNFSVVFGALGGEIARRPHGATAFGHRSANWFVELCAQWHGAPDSQAHLAPARRAWRSLQEVSRGPYVNLLPDADTGSAVRAYGGTVYDRLAVLKRDRDPANSFRCSVALDSTVDAPPADDDSPDTRRSPVTATDLIDELARDGVHLWEEDGKLRYRAPAGVLTDDRLARLRTAKEEVLVRLRSSATTTVRADEAGRFAPFPLTDVQAAYLYGRTDAFDFGGVACHVYLEVTYPDLDPCRTEDAWNRLIARHDMLRARILRDGHQEVVPRVDRLTVPADDLREATSSTVQRHLATVRADMAERVYDTEIWPLFGLRVSRLPDGAVLHVSMDFLIADWASLWLLLHEFEEIHADPDVEFTEPSIRFRDYVLAERAQRESGRFLRDRDYWLSRVDTLPAAPALPVIDGAGRADESSGPTFRRRRLRLDADEWAALSARSAANGVTSSATVLAAYAAVLERWSTRDRFTLNLTLLNRLPLHEDVAELVGDFTSVSLLEVDRDRGADFGAFAAAVGSRLFEDLDHRTFSGVEVLREVARRRGRDDALMPIVFTSAIGIADDSRSTVGRFDGFGVTQTPQVFIDCQAMDDVDGLQVNWDVRESVFPEGVVDDMFESFEALLRALAAGDPMWRARDCVALPARQSGERAEANRTDGPLPDETLDAGVLEQAARTPDSVAVIADDRQFTYRELVARAHSVAQALRAEDVVAGEHIAITMEKGIDQVAAVLGVLITGAVYVPLDTTSPALRRAAIMSAADIRVVLTQTCSAADALSPDPDRVVSAVCVDTLDPVEVAPLAIGPREPDSPAYVIYTSGSTGEPKGVVVSHRAALNTVIDIDRRFSVGREDRVLALASLGFDLSVYDLFGPLRVGGAVVIGDPDRRVDPSQWAELIVEHEVTIWNTVPALMQMLTAYLSGDAAESAARAPLRLVLLSGDWIPVTLADEVRRVWPAAEVVGLGGATEASIWSNFHRIESTDPAWTSVPYGRPLTNQRFHVLDEGLRDCPTWVTGELCIEGTGLAVGYLGDEDATAQRFITDPDGRRLYRTGDLGRYRPGGVLEFLGRADDQVKVNGHRIELGEIEAVLASNPAVAEAAAAVAETATGDRGLLAAVVPARVNPHGPSADVFTRVDEAAAKTGALARRAAERKIAVNVDDVDAYVRALDQAMLSAMAAALADLGARGPRIPSTVQPGLRWLVRRWQALLDRHQLESDVTSAALWDRVRDHADGIVPRMFVDYLEQNARGHRALLTGDQDPVELLMPGGDPAIANAMYRETVAACYLNRAVSTIVHRAVSAPTHDAHTPRVLEVGAGTGSTTRAVLEVLDGRDVEYLFTDVSPYFLPGAREQFGSDPHVSFGLFDVDLDYRAQGLAPNSFDVVLGAGVLENARDIDAAFGILVDLVRPGGWLVLTEPDGEQPWILGSQGFMMTPPDDERAGGASYLERDDWLARFRTAGAMDVVCLPDDDHPVARLGFSLYAGRLKADRVPVDASELLAFAADRLPAHMVPMHVQAVDQLPLTANGKVDRRTLASWRPVEASDDVGDGADDARDCLERTVADLWEETLATRLRRDTNLFERGADSLIMARIVGRLRDESADAAAIPFDTLLRAMLNGPTIAEHAEALRSRGGASADAPAGADPEGRGSNAGLVRFGGGGDGPTRVMFHAGLGTMECYRPLAAELVDQALGPVVGVVIDDPEIYCDLPVDEVVDRLADDYANLLIDEGLERVQLIGYCLGGMYATEVARRLTERAVEVVDLVLISSHPVPYDVDDDLMIESLFLPNIGISVEDVDFGPIDADDMVRGFMQTLDRNGDRIPQDSLVDVGGDPGLDRVGAFYRTMAGVDGEQRLAVHASTATMVTGQEYRSELVSGMFRVFRQSFRSARYSPEPYIGDIRFLQPTGSAGFAPGMDAMTLDFWRDVCIGDFSVTDIEGNHFSCVTPPNVSRVAELVAAPLVTSEESAEDA